MKVSNAPERARRQIEILRRVAEISDVFYPEAEALAKQLRDQSQKLRPSQLRNLETLANSSGAVSHIFDLVKTQIGRGKLPREAGQVLLDTLGELQDAGRRVAADSAEGDLARRVHLLLCREFLKHLVAHFTFLKPGDAE